MSAPTPLLALEAVRKVMTGDERANKVLERWKDEHPEIVLQAIQDWVSERLA